MTYEEIAELFIHAAEVDKRLPDTARPAKLKAQSLPYVHDHVDQAGWGGQRYEEERLAFWDALSTRLQTSDIADWERVNTLVLHVTRDRDRRCLWAWAKSKAGQMPFSKWCRNVENIHRNYGIQCKDRAIDQIFEYFCRNASIDVISGDIGTLHETPEIEHIPVTLNEPRHFAWMAPGAFAAQAYLEARDFSWAATQTEKRKQREARNKQAA